MGTSFIILSPVESDKDQFRENVNLIVQDLSGHDLSLEQYAEMSEKQIKSLITDGNNLSSEKVNDYYEVVYTGKQGVYS